MKGFAKILIEQHLTLDALKQKLEGVVDPVVIDAFYDGEYNIGTKSRRAISDALGMKFDQFNRRTREN